MKKINELIEFLSKHDITCEPHEHEPVYTVEDARRLVPKLPGVHTKNLFVRDSKGRRHLLIVTASDKRVNLARLAAMLGLSRLSFASPERLRRYLAVEPGAVSIFGLVHDRNHEVELVVDNTVWASDLFQLHPLVNTSTVVISKTALERFLKATGHEAKRIDVPE